MDRWINRSFMELPGRPVNGGVDSQGEGKPPKSPLFNPLAFDMDFKFVN